MTQNTSPKIRGVQTIIYPESDGEPMAETDIHRDLMVDMINMLRNHFRTHPDVYVSGNLLLYYEMDKPRKSVAPDVFVVFGVERKRRRTYRMWEEGKGPDVVLELTSRNTYRKDLGEKKDLYASVLKVKEYYLYDPDGQYLQPNLQGYRLVDGIYLPIQPTLENRFPSFVLGLELGERDAELGLYNPRTKHWLLKPLEESAALKLAEAEIQRESLARQQAEERMQQAEAELARLQTLLEQVGATDE